MKYFVKIKIKGQVQDRLLAKDDSELLCILKANESMTLTNPSQPYYEPLHDKNLSKWLSGLTSNDLELIPDTQKLAKCSKIKSKDEAYELISSKEWNGTLDQVTDFLQDRKFVECVLSSESWDGDLKHMSNNHLLNDLDFCRELLMSCNWNGDCKYFGRDVMNNQVFAMKVINSSKWNSDCKSFGPDVMKNYNICSSIVLHARWNGDSSHFKAMQLITN